MVCFILAFSYGSALVMTLEDTSASARRIKTPAKMEKLYIIGNKDWTIIGSTYINYKVSDWNSNICRYICECNILTTLANTLSKSKQSITKGFRWKHSELAKEDTVQSARNHNYPRYHEHTPEPEPLYALQSEVAQSYWSNLVGGLNSACYGSIDKWDSRNSTWLWPIANS